MNKAIPLLIVFVSMTIIAASANTVHASTYTYTLHGPYYEDGSVANADVSVAILWVNGSTLRFNMTGDGVTANTTIFTSTAQAYQMLWNASSALNFTRIIDFTNATSEELNIYIPSPLVPAGLYSFSVTDFTNMANPYLQTSISTDGATYHIVERRSLNTTGTATFVMAQYGTYTITIQCTQGTLIQTFTAENVFSINLPVLVGAFPTSNTTTPTLTAQRLNSSLIGIAYTDPSNLTDWLYLNITHRAGSTTIYDYNINNTGSSQTILWNLADSDKAYNVTGTASINGVNHTWIIPVPKLASANPWLGKFDWLGNYTATLPHVHSGWPEGMSSAQIAQLVAAAIIMLFLGVGSFRSAGACCVLAWIVGGVMIFLGWWGQTGLGTTAASVIPNWALAGFLSMFIVIQEGKETTRDA